MKITFFSILVVMFIAFAFVTNSFAQVLSQKHLPEGATARIGKGSAEDVKYSPDGTLIAVASSIGIWIYDAQTHQEIDLLTERSEVVWSVAFSPDGQTLAAGNNGTVKLWDVKTRQLKATLEGSGGWIMGVAFSPDGQTLASGDWNELKLWDVKTRQLKANFNGHTHRIWSVAFSPDGKTLASGSDTTVRLWNVDTGRLKHTLTGHKTEVRSVAYSPDGRTIASGSWYGGGPSQDNTVCIWDAHTGRLKHIVPGYSAGVAFSPDGRTLASVGWGEVSLLYADTGQLKATLRGIYDFGGGVTFSPDGQTLAGVINSIVRLWDVNTERHKIDLTGHAGNSPNIAFSPDGQTLASTDYATVRLWDANTGQHITNIVGHTNKISSIAFSPDGQTLVSGSWGEVRLWNVNADQPNANLILGPNKIGWREWTVSFSADGRTLAIGSQEEVQLWNVDTGQQKTILRDAELDGTLITYSSDGRTLATRSTDNTTVILWDTLAGEPLKVLTGHTRYPRRIVFSPDGQTLVSGSWGELLLWDVMSGQQKEPFEVKGGCNASGLAFSPDGSILVTEWYGTDVALWNVATRTQLTVLPGHGNDHQHQITSLAFNPNGNRVASAAVDGTVLLWDVTSDTSQPSESESQQPQRDSVRLVYFRPSDRTAQQGIDAHLTTLVKDVQRFYAAQMHRYGGKTFTLETDADENPVVHHLDGEFTDAYYQQDTFGRVQIEIEAAFDTDKHVYLVAVDVSNEVVNDGGQGEVCGIGGGGWQSEHDSEVWKRGTGGLAVIPASGNCFNVGVTAHELGHTFGLEHDFRDEAYLMSYGSQTRLSADAVEWLSVHRYFNTGQTGFAHDTTLTVVSLRASELKFQITDADGLHQVQLLIPTIASDPVSGLKLHSSKRLNGETDNTVMFAVPELTGNPEITLQVIDRHGHITKQTFSVETDSVVQVPDVDRNVARVSLSPASVWSGNVGGQFTVNANITDGADVRGYQVELTFDSTALRFISSTDAGYLPMDAFVVPPVLNGNRVTLSAISLQQSSEGDGTLATFTFEVLTASPAMPILSDVKLTDSNADSLAVQIETGEIEDSPQLAGDVNGDGVVSLDDMRAAVAHLGQTGENTADMNGDGVVDAADLLLIIDAIETAAAGPALSSTVLADMFTATEVRQWLSFARTKGLTDGRYQRGFLLLEQFLLMLIPKETLLLANYPNPFNPETWIPYQLAKSAEVSISIYAADGKLIRTLALGHQVAGIYHSRSRAAYWNGKNNLGESVASGVYYYTLTAGDFTATRKMLILK